MNSLAPTAPTPWYREPWPWILMAGPVAAVVAGAITLWIAVTHQDALVADDYYKQGLAINRTLDRQTAAATANAPSTPPSRKATPSAEPTSTCPRSSAGTTRTS